MNIFNHINTRLYILLGVYASLLLPLTFLGYGSDNDTYGVLSAGESTWGLNTTAMSRNPGYWLYEFLIYILNFIGGFYLTNIFSLVSAILVLASLDKLAKELEIQNRNLLLPCIAFNPWFIIASTSTMDYMLALLFIVWSFAALNSNKFIIAGMLAGLAIATRLGSIFPLAGIFIVFVISEYKLSNVRSYFLSILVALGVTLVFYIPSWYVSGMNFNFMQAGVGDESLWSLKMYVGRFVYKIIYLFGLPTFLCLVTFFCLAYKQNILGWPKNKIEKMSLGAIIGALVLFAKYPIESSYLLPALIFFYLILGSYLDGDEKTSRLIFALIFVLTLISCFIEFPLARPNVNNLASDAQIGLQIEKGALINDLQIRLKLKECDSMACYEGIFSDPSQVK